jgi:hypothetical protein
MGIDNVEYIASAIGMAETFGRSELGFEQFTIDGSDNL